jgi:NADH-quinone oxidoreductase subunit J
MDIHLLAFLAVAGTTVGASLVVITGRTIAAASVALIAMFLGTAGLFFMLDADLLGIVQILVNGVGVTIILLFGIMMTGRETGSLSLGKSILASVPAFLLSAAVLAALVRVFLAMPSIPWPAGAHPLPDGTSKIIGRALLSNYGLAFEAASLLLLAAIVGAVVLSRKDRTGGDQK